MKAESLLVSTAINIGLALFVISLFSLLKTRTFCAPIYYPRRLSLQPPPPHSAAPLARCPPSGLSWIRRAVSVSDDRILETHGLDVLVFVRIKFFVGCSLVGVLVLLPLNYFGSNEESKSYHSTDSFTISNISSGSNWLWVHFSVLCFVSCYGLYLLYKVTFW
ncbi:unnamed protein product [Cuscuta campestris]|uniref:CSC1/OSCA1-like N-terminal transmembrane domain-containing protein n=1 Tax=Cuscuta campestris TaxID=132261 RepID=A0A484KH51_9ASTE|nr:unnamed protein product [Cuscuta campestris]